MKNNYETLTLSLMQLEAFISLWLCKTRIEIEQLCKNNETLKNEMLKSLLFEPLEAWHKIKEKTQTKIVDIEDCTILGYSWSELKKIVNFAKSKNYNPKE